MNRREFLRGCGVGLGSLSLPSLARGNSATPKRFLIFYTQHGVWYDGWKMRLGDHSADQSWNFKLSQLQEYSEALQPLRSLATKSIVVDALSLASAELDSSGLRHELGGVHSLTGANMTLVGSTPLASAPSIDQIIASQIATPMQFPSLEWGVGDNPRSVIYRAAKDMLPICNQPVSAAQRLFGMEEQSSLMMQQNKILSAVQQDYQGLSSRLSAGDKRKVEQHAELLVDLQSRLNGLDSLRTDCAWNSNVPYVDDYDDVFAAFVPLISTAFSCDLSRVISLQMGQIPSQSLYPGETFDVHSDAAHKVWQNAGAADVMTRYTNHHAGQLATLAAALDSVIDPQGDGSETLLDNTMIIWVGELGDGAHGFERWPAMILGGNAFSSFHYDRYLYHPSHTPIEAWSFSGTLSTIALPHQHFLTSIAQQFGVETAIGTGSLQGGRIDCTSPLEGLL